MPEGSILGPHFFFIPNGLIVEYKLLTGGTSLFSVAHDVKSSASDVNKDLKLISDWDFHWKISFNPDPSKQAQEIIFS